MRTIEQVRAHCRVDEDEHWLWRGATCRAGRARIYAPDYTHGGEMVVQQGARAVWHLHTGQPIAPGRRVFLTCGQPSCCNPDHMAAMTPRARGAKVARSGAFKGVTGRILANRATCRARSVLTSALIAEIQTSPETGREIAARLGLSEQMVSKARRGLYFAFAGGSVFSGLIAASAARGAGA